MTDVPTTPVRVERDGDLAVVVLDHPPLNLFDESVFAGFEHAVAERLGRLDDRFGRHVTVRVSEKGTLS